MTSLLLKRALTFLLILPLLTGTLAAQQDQLIGFLKEFQEFQENNPTEKVFLHLDKTEYAQAETIWMKSYLVAGAGHLPSPLSANVYVELLTEKGDLVKRLTLKSEQGMAKASLIIPRNQPQGQYYLRAYTNWMKNQDQGYFYNKKIRILSTSQTELPELLNISKPYALRFFPEGGDLVKGLPNRLAFEVSGAPDAQERLIKGKIMDASGNMVKEFATSHEGRGMVAFVPDGEGYTATLDGVDEVFPLPAIRLEGQSMTVNNKREDYVTVSIKSSSPSEAPFYVVVHTRGYITYAAESRLTGTRGFVKIDKASLPSGISHVTLFNQNMEPLAERLIFVDHCESINVSVNLNKPQYGNRELATVGIEVRDAEGKPVQGSFSLSAYNSDLTINDQAGENIRVNLLLSSDLKGHVNNPQQYFDGTPEALANLDLLMMVNGWRRFNWTDIKTSPEELFPVEQGLRLEGHLTKAAGGKVKEGKVLLVNGNRSAGGNSSRYVLADEEGRFTMTDLDYADTTYLRFQGFQKAGTKNVKIDIDTSAAPPLPLKYAYSQPGAFINPLRDAEYKKYAKTAIFIDSTYRRVNGITYLGEVTVVADKREEKYRVLQSQYGKGEAFLNFDDIPFEQKSGRDPYTMMFGRIAGFRLQPPAGLAGASPTGQPTGYGSRSDAIGNADPTIRAPQLRSGAFIGTPLVFVDNVEVPWDLVYNLQANEIDYVEVYKSGSANMFGTRGFSGAIAIYTLKGSKYFEQLPKKGLLYTQVGGYHVAREFYAPRYDTKRRQRYVPDQRATVFWEPMITTDEHGRAMVDFYTPDDTGYITIDVQGISFSGQPGSGNAGFSIRSNN